MSNEYVIINTLSHFKSKYVIPLKEFEALGFTEPLDRTKMLNLLASGSIKEFSQSHLGDVVGDVSVYSEEDTLFYFDQDNAYLSGWTKEKKLEWINNWKEDS